MQLSKHLELPRCPHCSIARPTLSLLWACKTANHDETLYKQWGFYSCSSCGNVVSAWADPDDGMVRGIFPEPPSVDEEIPDRPRKYLQQAYESIHAPAGSLMLSSRAVDSMLQLKGYNEGSLHKRIGKAVEKHLITEEMASWANEVRIDANEQRHADIDAELPDAEDAKRAIEFVKALAQFLFVLPAKITRGLGGVEPKDGE